tara:strand:+ start:102751 stop:105615 length:2865 start_codon:yes stop_codon:yes gene_type:complete
MRNILFPLSFLGILVTWGQAPSPKETILRALQEKKSSQEQSLVGNIPFQNIGPTIMGGRVVDLDVNPDNPIEFYVGYASGGLWYTNNNGTSFTPVMDSSPTQNVGDIAVHWKSGTLWVGTGENNASRSSYAGVGLLKSIDKGKNWELMGLEDSHHIGRILINPENPDEVVVGASGHLYSSNGERGIYRTSDGGQTWKKTLFITDDTGIIDLAMSPHNFNVQYAASWQKDRKAWDFIGSGTGSGLYKSMDGGNSWEKISTLESGFPTGLGVGRIGLAVFDDNTIYAVHDNQYRRTHSNEIGKMPTGLQKDDFKDMDTAAFLKIEDKQLNEFLKTNGFHEKYRAANVKQLVESGSVKPIDLANYLEDANSMLFDTLVVGAEVYRSEDGGKTWKKQHETFLEDLFYSYGYYFAQIAVDPSNKEKIYLAGVPIIRSDDGGKTFSPMNGDNVHSDHHAIWIDPKLPRHIINGNDGGVNISYDDGATWIKNNSPAVGQFYYINTDNKEPYNVYGGLQDNGVWMGPHTAKETREWHQEGHYPWKSILGGDGMQVQIDSRNNNLVYTGYQFGNYFRLDLEKGERTYIQPKHELGESPYRFNWQSPILLSPHNQDILYFGGNKLHRSLNKGADWETISGDLTRGGKKGNVAYGTLTSISESPFKFGTIYTGSDDGMLQLTTDGGNTWEVLEVKGPNIPNDISTLWISRVLASQHRKERVYVTYNGYRSDHFTPYVFLSDDFGKTWKDIASNIPVSPVNAVIEDMINPDMLYVGTDNGAYITFDQGENWHAFSEGLPAVAVHDLRIQSKAQHLLLGTHGRSIYKADIRPLQELAGEGPTSKLTVFPVDNIKHSERWGITWDSWSEPSTPGLDIHFFTAIGGAFMAKVQTESGITVSETEVEADTGFNILSYDVAFTKEGLASYLRKNKMELKEAANGKTYLPKGNYNVEISGNGLRKNISFTVE